MVPAQSLLLLLLFGLLPGFRPAGAARYVLVERMPGVGYNQVRAHTHTHTQSHTHTHIIHTYTHIIHTDTHTQNTDTKQKRRIVSPTIQTHTTVILTRPRPAPATAPQQEPSSLGPGMLEEVVQALSPPFNPRMRTGVSVLFSLLQDDSPNGATVLDAIRTLLAASATTQVRPGPSVGDVTHYRHASIAPRSQPSSHAAPAFI